ncbi:GPR1/FUN34/YaaH family transporter [Rhodococcoides yunnanense]|uniref:GPR1/FUN34/YaaH family transporter n=1 Tax=Rhodococcoides yunnanense TaxID=278209 RepID=UPI000932E4A9|nr:GPR1/FUN34/YaaH family transporter [Rhodococcus yunnanensis]
MTTTDAPTNAPLAESPAPAGPGSPVADPALIGVPTFLVGSIALGLVLTGYVPAAATGASIPIILAATAIGQLVAAVWAASRDQNAVASVFGIFTGFWLSYALLVLGLTNDWFGIVADDAVATQKLFLLTWLVVIVLLTVASLRLPLAFTVLFALIDLALLFVFLGTSNASTSQTSIGGYFVFSFVVVGAYLFLDAMSRSTGGRGLPLGRAIVR